MVSMQGEMGAVIMMRTQEALEKGIEDLRYKYARKDAEKKARAARGEDIDGTAAAGGASAAPSGSDAAESSGVKDGDDTGPDAELRALRARRLAYLKKRAKKTAEARKAGHGDLREIKEEEFLKEVTSSKRVVVHFFHGDFKRCAVMDKHLRVLAPRLAQTKFLRLDATKAPFFVGKLAVRIMPTLVGFIDGVARGRQLGFQGLGGSEDFNTGLLVEVLRGMGVADEEECVRVLDEIESRGTIVAGSAVTGSSATTGDADDVLADKLDAARADGADSSELARIRMQEELERRRAAYVKALDDADLEGYCSFLETLYPEWKISADTAPLDGVALAAM